MLRGRNREFLELRETSPNCIEVKFSVESKVIELGLDTEALQLNKSKKASKNMIFLSMENTRGRLGKSKISFQRLVKFFNFPSFLIDCVDVSCG